MNARSDFSQKLAHSGLLLNEGVGVGDGRSALFGLDVVGAEELFEGGSALGV